MYKNGVTNLPCNLYVQERLKAIQELVLSHYRWQRQLGIVQYTEWENGDVEEMNKYL